MNENTFKLEYNATGDDRKRLVQSVADFRNSFSEYSGAPTFNYTVDEIVIDRSGALVFPHMPDEEEIISLKEFLKNKGFLLGGEGSEPAADVTETEEENGIDSAADSEEDEEDELLTIEIPKEGFTEEAIMNLHKLIDGHATLLKKSLDADDLTIKITEDKICFPWFRNPDPFNVPTYTKLIEAIGKSAKKAKRVNVKDHEVTSEKYAFRIWLLRLGFVGEEYKNDRAILLKNLSGTSAFKNGEDARAFSEKLKAKRTSEKMGAPE